MVNVVENAKYLSVREASDQELLLVVMIIAAVPG